MVDLKTSFSLAMLNKYYLDVTKEILNWFWSDILGKKFLTLYTALLYCMIMFSKKINKQGYGNFYSQ